MDADTEELGTKSLQKNLEYNGYRSSIKMVTEETGHILVTEKLRTQWLQVFDQNGYRRTGSRMVTK